MNGQAVLVVLVLQCCSLDNGNYGSVVIGGTSSHLVGWGESVTGLWSPPQTPTLVDPVNGQGLQTGLAATLNGNDQGGSFWYRSDDTMWCKWVTPYCGIGDVTGGLYIPEDDQEIMAVATQMLWRMPYGFSPVVPGDIMNVVGGRWGGCVIIDVTAPGEMWCWGYDRYGAMGFNHGPYGPYAHEPWITKSTNTNNVPTGWSSVVIADTGEHACGVSRAGKLFCWGANLGGVVDPNADDRNCAGEDIAVYPTPQAVLPGLDFKHVSLYGMRACATTTDNQIWCWGAQPLGNYGIPLPWVTGLDTYNACGWLQEFPSGFHDVTAWINYWLVNDPADSVSLGLHGGCVRGSVSNRVYCWGSNVHGLLGQCNECADIQILVGLGPSTPIPLKVKLPVNNDPDWVVVSLPARMSEHACVEGVNLVTGEATTWCWGSNFMGQLGRSIQPIVGCVNPNPYNDNSCPEVPKL